MTGAGGGPGAWWRRAASRLRRRRGDGPPAVVLAVTLLWGALLLGYSLLTPLATATDEYTHGDLVFHLATGAPYPEHDGRVVGAAAMHVNASRRPHLFWHVATPDNAPPSGERLTFAEAGGDGPSGRRIVNQMPQHPPLYYELASTALRVERRLLGTDTSLDREWYLVRWVNVALMLPLPALAWAAARRLGSGHRAAVVASLLPLAVPQLAHVGASLGNDPLLTLLMGTTGALLAGVLAGDHRRSTAVSVGVVAGLALLTKAFALVLVPWIAAAYGWRAWRHRHERRAAAGGLAIAGALTAAVAGWWWIGNLVRDGELTPTTEDELYTTAMRTPGFSPDEWWFARHFGSLLPRRFWGHLGWYEVPVGTPLVVLASASLVLAVVAAFVRGRRLRLARPLVVGRRSLAVFLLPLPLLFGMVLYRAHDLYVTTSRTPFIQGRYLFGALVPLAVAVGIGAVRLLGRWAPAVVVAGAVVLHVEAVRLALRAWWGERGASVGRSFASLLAWNRWPLPLVWLTVGTIAAALVVLVGLLVRDLPGGAARDRRTTAALAVDAPVG